jgi:hypothetical protein
VDPLVTFVVLKLGFVAVVLALAVREVIVTRRGDSNPEFTAKLVRVFSAGERARRARAGTPAAPVPAPAPAPAPEPEPLRRAA